MKESLIEKIFVDALEENRFYDEDAAFEADKVLDSIVGKLRLMGVDNSLIIDLENACTELKVVAMERCYKTGFKDGMYLERELKSL